MLTIKFVRPVRLGSHLGRRNIAKENVDRKQQCDYRSQSPKAQKRMENGWSLVNSSITCPMFLQFAASKRPNFTTLLFHTVAHHLPKNRHNDRLNAARTKSSTLCVVCPRCVVLYADDTRELVASNGHEFQEHYAPHMPIATSDKILYLCRLRIRSFLLLTIWPL